VSPTLLDKILATAQFEVEAKDAALGALNDYRRGRADFSDYLLGQPNRQHGADESLTFDRTLKAVEGFRLI
jgi:predicted nucleic-acid-binding protein